MDVNTSMPLMCSFSGWLTLSDMTSIAKPHIRCCRNRPLPSDVLLDLKHRNRILTALRGLGEMLPPDLTKRAMNGGG